MSAIQIFPSYLEQNRRTDLHCFQEGGLGLLNYFSSLEQITTSVMSYPYCDIHLYKGNREDD